MTIIRPGPSRIGAGAEPGGVVIHVYAVPTGRLLHTSSAASYAEAEARAGPDAETVFDAMRDDETAVCLVAYDGDTGERMSFTP